MPTVAFEASAASEGESCRDLAFRVGHPTALRSTAPGRALGAEIGGPRGCSRARADDRTAARSDGRLGARRGRAPARSPARPPGERIFRRDVTVDGHELSGDLYLTLQMNDLHFAPIAPGAAAGDRFAAQVEVRAAPASPWPT